MRDPILIDLNEEQEVIPAGYIGEHNATTLRITPPLELQDSADYYRAEFGIYGSDYPSEQLTGTSFDVKLWQDVTAINQSTMTLVAYKADGSYIGKSQMITLSFEEAVGGSIGEFDSLPHGIAVDVAALLVDHHNHTNKATLDLFSTTVRGKAAFDGGELEDAVKEYLNLSDLPPVSTDDLDIAIVTQGASETLSDTIVNVSQTPNAESKPIFIRPILELTGKGLGAFTISDSVSGDWNITFTDNGLTLFGVACKLLFLTQVGDLTTQWIYSDRNITVNLGDEAEPLFIDFKKGWSLLVFEEESASVTELDYSEIPSFENAVVGWPVGEGGNTASVYDFLSTIAWTFKPAACYSQGGLWHVLLNQSD